MRLRFKQFRKLQIVGFQNLSQNSFVELVEIENSDFTFQTGNIINDLIGLGFPQTEIIIVTAIHLNQVYKCIYRKGIMLCRNAEFLFSTGLVGILFRDQSSLLQNLSGIAQKHFPLFGNKNAFIGAVENGDAHFLFQFLECFCQAGLGNIQ